nr:MAG TPA: hypothetical protein [Caudoviricetes sp.]
MIPLFLKHCIIFGQPTQAEHSFSTGCYFCTLFYII